MTPIDLPASGMALFFLLGLRHGIEPDHIAAIDGLTLRAHDHHEPHAPWTGSLFALGHGLAIAVIAVGISFVAASFTLPSALVQIVDWLPVVLLALLGAWNLRALLAPGAYRPSSVRMKLIPAALRERTDLWSTVAIGLLFALVIDTVAHVSAWSVFATHQGGWWAGAMAGLLFSGGMLIASTADSQLVSRMLRSARTEAAASQLRRGIGWFVVLLSFAVVVHAVMTRLGG
jgi:nickel/cobalt transporter (NiCoT) family protein